MMLRPTITELTKGKINRYELTLATAKCACAINSRYLKQKELAEKAALAGKDSEFIVDVDRILADVKPVRVAIDRIYEGRYKIVRMDPNAKKDAETADMAAENASSAKTAGEHDTANEVTDTEFEGENA